MAKLTERVLEGAHVLLEKAGDLQERIRDRARAIWEREGKPEGRDEDHWREAERDIAAEDADRFKKKPARTSKKTKEKPVSSTESKPRKSSKASAPVAASAPAKEAAGKGKSGTRRIPAKTVGSAKPRRSSRTPDKE